VLAQQVVATAGEEFKNDIISISWTLGEPAIETLKSNSIILTQGFQQSDLRTNSNNAFVMSKANIKLYPNPTEDKMSLIVFDQNQVKLKYFLHDIEGKVMSSGSLSSPTSNIDLEFCPNGIYLLRLLDERGHSVRSFRVIKH
jgi:hypothetical protein